MRGDLHQALKTEELGKQTTREVDLKIVRLHYGKNDSELTLHALPRVTWSAGVQIGEALALFGFRRSDQCTFFYGNCLVQRVAEDFSLESFATAFPRVFTTLREAADALRSCGLSWDARNRTRGVGDGHTAQKVEKQKETENEHFRFVLTLLDGGATGWTTHYIPKHPPLSPELAAAMSFLDVDSFASCPEHDFEPCRWRNIPFEARRGGFWDSNVDVAHALFDAHSQRFSTGIEKLLTANRDMASLGMGFLSLPSPRVAPTTVPPRGGPTSQPAQDLLDIPDRFDVAVSFAGAERAIAEQLAAQVRNSGFAVFYDNFYPEHLWGRNLVDFFDEIYRKRSRRCVIFVSKDYVDRAWTNHERQSAQARALKEKGNEYILPIQVDGTELPGMAPTTGYVSLREHSIGKIAEMLVSKLRK